METVRSVHLNLNFSSHFSLVLITFLSRALSSGLWPMKITFHNVNDLPNIANYNCHQPEQVN